MSEPRGQLRTERLTFPGAPIFADWKIITRGFSHACMGVLWDVLGCSGVTSVLTRHPVCGMERREIDRQPWNGVFGRTRKPLPPLQASPQGPVTSQVVRFSRSVTHLWLTAVWVGTLERDHPRRSVPEMRHSLSMDAPRHEAVMALARKGLSVFALQSKAPRHEVWAERARSLSPVCHERMKPSRSPSVPRGQERSPGVDTLLDYDESHWLWWIPQGVFGIQSWTELWWWRVVGFATSSSSNTTPGR